MSLFIYFEYETKHCIVNGVCRCSYEEYFQRDYSKRLGNGSRDDGRSGIDRGDKRDWLDPEEVNVRISLAANDKHVIKWAWVNGHIKVIEFLSG
jgi:hypothetical protein